MEKHIMQMVSERRSNFKFQVKCMYTVTSLTFSIPRLEQKFPESLSWNTRNADCFTFVCARRCVPLIGGNSRLLCVCDGSDQWINKAPDVKLIFMSCHIIGQSHKDASRWQEEKSVSLSGIIKTLFFLPYSVIIINHISALSAESSSIVNLPWQRCVYCCVRLPVCCLCCLRRFVLLVQFQVISSPCERPNEACVSQSSECVCVCVQPERVRRSGLCRYRRSLGWLEMIKPSCRVSHLSDSEEGKRERRECRTNREWKYENEWGEEGKNVKKLQTWLH